MLSAKQGAGKTMRTTTLKDAFAHFGAVAANPVWAWSARSPDGATVVLTAWEDEFDPNTRPAVMDYYGDKDLARWTNRTGNKDRIRNLIHARDFCDRRFHVVMVKAKDVNASRRSILSRAPHPIVMRLEELDEKTGEFRAVSVER
jgi:hypothetical protein